MYIMKMYYNEHTNNYTSQQSNIIYQEMYWHILLDNF